MPVIDLAALRRAVERNDGGPMAVVDRLWLGTVLRALENPGCAILLDNDRAPMPMVPA